MSTILTNIIAAKKKEIEKYKQLSSIERFQEKGFFWKFSNRSLKANLQRESSSGIIAEFKRKSPSKGWFKQKELEVEKVVKAYNDGGAAGISVLTDDEFFGGDLDDLIQAKIVTDVPVLRKDFIIDPWQIAEAKAFGADIILLIAASLSREQVKSFARYAQSIGLESLLEIHQENELDHICEEVDMIGINNRNLDTFEVDINTSLRLINKLPVGKPAVAESGISDVNTIVTLKQAGFKGFLIGETFMKQEDPGQAFHDFAGKLRQETKTGQ